MVPACFPKVIDEEVDGKCILVLWVTTGAGRPYKAPEHVTSKKEKTLLLYSLRIQLHSRQCGAGEGITEYDRLHAF